MVRKLITNLKFITVFLHKMGNEQAPSGGRADGRSSMGNYDDYNSFGAAFHAAHASGGSGHTFTYHGKMYTTDCKDGGDYRAKQDNREPWRH